MTASNTLSSPTVRCSRVTPARTCEVGLAQAHAAALAERRAAEEAAEEARRGVAARRAEDAALREQLAELRAATEAAREARYAVEAKRADAEQVCNRLQLQSPY